MASKTFWQITNGRLGNNPDLRYTQAGQAICFMSIADNEQWRDKNDNLNEKTNWFRVKLFGKLAETAANYLAKGSRVHVEGRMSTSTYEKDGQSVYAIDFLVNKMLFLSDRKENRQGTTPPSTTQQKTKNATYTTKQIPPQNQTVFTSEDIPFADDECPF